MEDGEAHLFAPAAQVLLVCCWRTMKEVALLLGELSHNNAPTNSVVVQQESSLLSSEQVRNHLLLLLLLLLSSSLLSLLLLLLLLFITAIIISICKLSDVRFSSNMIGSLFLAYGQCPPHGR